MDTNTQGDPVAIGFTHTYDYANNKLRQDVLHDPQDGQLYAYDSANRLTAFVRGELESDYCEAPTTAPLSSMTQGRRWDLDGLGNWEQTVTKVADGFTTDTASHTSFNEYYSFAGSSLEHDANGNLTSGTLNQYVWDGFNRLREVRDKNGSLIASYLYDADNRRIRKDLATGTDVDYHYAGWRVLAEYENGGSNPKRHFVYGIGLDEPLVMDVNEDNDSYTTGAQDSRYYYHQNTLGSVYGLSNEDGDIIEAYEYDPYGKHWVIYNNGNAITFTSSDSRTTQGLSNYGNPYLFTGRRWDHESKFQYSRFRYYDPILGRFISRDPIGYADCDNLYEYVFDSPTGYTDALGLQAANRFSDVVGTQVSGVDHFKKPPIAETVQSMAEGLDRFAGHYAIRAIENNTSKSDRMEMFHPDNGPVQTAFSAGAVGCIIILQAVKDSGELIGVVVFATGDQVLRMAPGSRDDLLSFEGGARLGMGLTVNEIGNCVGTAVENVVEVGHGISVVSAEVAGNSNNPFIDAGAYFVGFNTQFISSKQDLENFTVATGLGTGGLSFNALKNVLRGFRISNPRRLSLIDNQGSSNCAIGNIPNGKGGRWGNANTRAQNHTIADELERRGWEVINIGGRRNGIPFSEEYIPGPGGSRKGSAYPDITAIKNGRYLRINTYDTLADGMTPTLREATNAAKIRGLMPGDHLLLIPKIK